MPSYNDAASISRATSVSRRSNADSTRSRAKSLIQKNMESADLRPSDVLIERFVAWKAIVKQLIAYFEGIADIENNTAKELTKLGGVIQVPFRAGNQFLGEGGLQDVFFGIRDKTRSVADQHANLARTIDSSIVQHLNKLRAEIKAHIKNIQNDTGKLATAVAKERELSARLIGDLSTGIAVFKATPLEINSRSDPYVSNAHVLAQLTKQVHAENALTKSTIIMQQNSAHFEHGLVRALQSAWATFDEWQARMSAAVQETWRAIGAPMAALEPELEWIEFAARSDQLVDPDTPLRNPLAIQYPGRDDPAVLAAHTGYLERKKRFTRAYREGYYVLSPAGFLHEYASADPAQAAEPTWSLFLPACTLGPPSKATALSGSHKFHIEWKRRPNEQTKTGLKRLSSLGRSSSSAYTFRARSHAELMEWWNDVRMLCSRYLVASDEVERAGPVMAAVRAAGYASEDDSGSEAGSSVDERDADDDGDAGFASAPEDANGPATDDETLGGANLSRAGSKKTAESPHVLHIDKRGRVLDGDDGVDADTDGGERGRGVQSRFRENA